MTSAESREYDEGFEEMKFRAARLPERVSRGAGWMKILWERSAGRVIREMGGRGEGRENSPRKSVFNRSNGVRESDGEN